MYLNKLSENEKRAFMAFAKMIQEVDGNNSENENILISEYCREMEINGTIDRKYSVEDLIEEFNGSTIITKKIVLFEAIGLAYADGEYDEAEKELIRKVANGIGITNSVIGQLDDYVLKYIVLVDEIGEMIRSNYVG